jgi:hypothetical protein
MAGQQQVGCRGGGRLDVVGSVDGTIGDLADRVSPRTGSVRNFVGGVPA